VAVSAGCTLLRSFDGYSDEWGRGDAATPSDVSSPSDVEITDAGVVPDIAAPGADARTMITCVIEDVATVPGGAYGITVAPSQIYVIFAVGDGGTIRVLDKAVPDAAAPPIFTSTSEPIEGCVLHGADLVCAIGARLVAIHTDRSTIDLWTFPDRIDEIDHGDDSGVGTGGDQDGEFVQFAITPHASAEPEHRRQSSRSPSTYTHRPPLRVKRLRSCSRPRLPRSSYWARNSTTPSSSPCPPASVSTI